MKKKLTPILVLLLFCANIFAQVKKVDVIKDIQTWQQELNDEYKNRAKSPLNAVDFKKFEGHTFFEIDTTFRVIAKIILSKSKVEIPFKTSTTSIQTYTKYADLHFTLKGVKQVLAIYQSKSLMSMPEYADYLFLPFFDETTGNETYGAGRYIDLRIPKKGNKIILDFNKAYNPYCAYATGFSCPKVPAENELKTKILAGVKYNPTH
jgi:uncharacterized protein